MKCEHDGPEMAEASQEVGSCPLCLQEENRILRYALEFYANKIHYTNGHAAGIEWVTEIESDGGAKAREALKEIGA